MKNYIPIPASVDIALTGKCNLACKYCFYADEMVALDDLPTASWLRFFEEIRDAGVMKVTLSGGEVFTRSDVWELIESVVRNKMRFSILTNATLIDEDVADNLERFRRRLDYIQVSIDGADAATHDAIRGRGAFDRLMAGINNLRRHNLAFTVRTTINKLNVFHLEDILNFLFHELNLKRFGVMEAFPRGAGQCNNSMLEMTREERRHAFRVMQAFDQEHPGVARGAQAGPLITAELIDKINHAKETGDFSAKHKTGYLTGCNAMWQKIAVLHDGTYIPCHQLPSVRLGKIGEDSFVDVWRNSTGLINLRKRRDIPLELLTHCKGCSYQLYCTGGCPGVAYALSGDVNTVNPFDCYRAYTDEDSQYAY